MTKHLHQAVILLVALFGTLNARPQDSSLQASNESSGFGAVITAKPEKTLEDIAVVARSSYVPPPPVALPVKVAEALVEKDLRTPPKLKDVTKEKNETVLPTTTPAVTTAVEKVEANGRFQVPAASVESFEGKAASSKKDDVVKGVAVPVIMDEEIESPPKKLQKLPNVAKPKDEPKKKVSTVKPMKENPTTTPSSGLSTWILLSDNREATTPTSAKKKITTTTKKPVKLQVTTLKTATAKPTKKITATIDKKPEPQSALEVLVKQKTASTAVSAQKKKENEKPSIETRKVVTVPPAIAIQSAATSVSDATTTEIIPETTTKKKTSSKKRKKNKKKKKPALEKSGADQVINDLVKQPKQPVGAQFYNFLSREIMPTVGLGLVGVLVTAGLAGLLGYNPFYGANIPVRRTYETQHGYYPNGNYYNNYRHDYPDTDTGKNEEVLFREVLSGMPEDSRYGLPPADASYPESQLYSSQEQAYQAASKNNAKTTEATYSEPYVEPQYDSYTNQEQVGAKYPVYSGDSYYSEPSTEKFKVSSKYSEDDTFEKQPEALYRVSGEYSEPETASSDTAGSDQSWHRIGSPMDSATYVEPGPRRLDLAKMTENLTHKRSRRSPEGLLSRLVRRSNEVVKNFEDDKENEIDFGDGAGNFEEKANTEKAVEVITEKVESNAETTTSADQTTATTPSTLITEESQPSLMESFPTMGPANEPSPTSLMDVLRRLAQFKLRLGINFLKSATDAFGKYLEGVQQRVEDTYANETSFPVKRYAWLGRDVAAWEDEGKIRDKRYQRATKDSSEAEDMVATS